LSLQDQVSASNCVAVGQQSLTNLTSGSSCVGIGALAGAGLTTETGSTCIGHSSQCTGHSNSIALGISATTTASNQLMVGNVNSVVASTSADLGTTALPFKDLTLSGQITSVQPRIKLLKNVLQTLTAYQSSVATWNTEEFNVGFPTFVTGQNGITVSTAGMYMIGYEATTDITTIEGFMSYVLLNSTSNGTTVRRYGQGHGIQRVTGSTMMNLNVGDVIRIGLRNFTSGSHPFPQTTDLSHQMEFWAYKLG
jgi:hypothetical protein